MNTEHIEKFVNAIACDLEEGGFRQVSGTTLRRSLTEAVSAALPLLADTGIPASQPAELSFDVEAMLTACVPGGSIVDPQVVADNIRAWFADRKPAELAEQQGVEGTGHSTEDNYQHFLSYSGLDGDDLLRYAYYHGADVGLERPALAATGKQQVGEESAGLPEMCRSSTNAQGIQAGEVQGDSILRAAVAPPRRFDRVAAEAELSTLAARQPGAQEPVAWKYQDKAADGVWEDRISEKLPCWERRNPIPLYAGPPAQAIGLGQFRKAVEAWKRDAENKRRVGDLFPEQKDAIWKEADRLLALIDSQRDAAPGVGS